MRRRDFIRLLGGAATWPLAARAQQSALPVIGFLSGSSSDGNLQTLAAFRQGLKETGFVEGQNVAIEYRWTEGRYVRMQAAAADLVQRRVAVIAATTGTAAAAKAATTTVPIVFTTGGDPVAEGLVASLNRPGGNLTGVTFLAQELAPKRLELLHQLVPTATLIAALVDPTDAAVAERNTRDLQAAARTLGLQIRILNASTEPEIDAAFAIIVQHRAGALAVGAGGFFYRRHDQIVALAARHAIPTIYPSREHAVAGGLISYDASRVDAYRPAGNYTGRVLKGEKPADLPVQQSSKFELVINLKTAKALGLTVPPTMLTLADEVIE
jgi:putative tryptophan/tyrosine transport system substrate-binding protein